MLEARKHDYFCLESLKIRNFGPCHLSPRIDPPKLRRGKIRHKVPRTDTPREIHWSIGGKCENFENENFVQNF